MTFADLTPVKNDLYLTNETALANKSDDEIINLYLDVAKEQVKMDLQLALNLSVSDDSELDSIASNHASTITKAISKKQLQNFYNSIDDGEGSFTNRKARAYADEYSTFKSLFSKLRSSNVSNISTVSAWM